MRLILASASPRRCELLRQAGFEFESRASGADEARGPDEPAEEFATRMAREKAGEVAKSAPPGSLVLGADTVVAIDGEILGKPRDAPDAARMLRLLAGRTHTVITGVCLIQAPGRLVALKHAATQVAFRPLGEVEINDYIRSGEPLDKAGAYGIQGLASKFVTRIEGCYSNVVGLPVSLVYEMLKPFSKLSD
jgi:septum formation protein